MPDGHVHNYAHMTNFRKFAPLDLLSFFFRFFFSFKKTLVDTHSARKWLACVPTHSKKGKLVQAKPQPCG